MHKRMIGGTWAGAKLAAVVGLIMVSSWGRSHPANAEELTAGDLAVEVNASGLLTSVVSGPMETVDGPKYVFDTSIHEWFGVGFDERGQRTFAVGSGDRPDWAANRVEVTPVSFVSSGDTATSIVRVGGLELTTELRFDGARTLIVTVTLSNRAEDPIRNILYSREWENMPSDSSQWTFPYDYPGTGVAAPGIARRFWMPDDLLPRQSRSLTFSFRRVEGTSLVGPTVDVPLQRWLGGSFPGGLNFGATNGVSFGDYDADGWIDVFACMSGNLWRNLEGTDWELVADLDSVLPFTQRRYGSSFGDYNNDGLPDIGTEPRDGWGGDECMHLLRNEGGTTFTDILIDPQLVDLQPCSADAETICWGDVDCDGDLDCFLPVYPQWAFGGPGNFFLTNLGPTGPGGQYAFTENSAAVGVDNPPPASARSEGAQFTDIDSDGDMDLYCNGTLYQNISSLGNPLFRDHTEITSGIGLSTALDEGAMFFDKDLDGDFDLFVVYTGPGVRIWENRGDGQFFMAPISTVESPFTGLDLGMSAEDWDNDGDIDFTTRQVFRRNQLMETGSANFTVASTNIIPGHLTSATPAWGDWDKDGDLDCALGNWLSTGNFYENVLYDGTEPLSQRRFVRVRVVRDSDTVPAGLETEYGATVEIVIRGDTSPHRRKKFVSSAAGYINQSEYTLHFAVPDDPAPADDAVDLFFDVVVDFPSLPSEGLLRVDRRINSALGRISLADLISREIVVFRSGRVVIDGAEFLPQGYEDDHLTLAAGGLIQATDTAALPAPIVDIPSRNVGVAFDTFGATELVRIRELWIDGQLVPTFCVGATANVFLWDVTDPVAPFRIEGGVLEVPGYANNRRTIVPVDILLKRDRAYRLVAAVSTYRATPIVAPIDHGNLTVLGGLNYLDGQPCTGDEIASETVDPGNIYMSFRFSNVAFVAEDFIRGDCNQDGSIMLSDAVFFLTGLFGGGGAGFDCADACDSNDDGFNDLADAIYSLNALFTGGTPVTAPQTCGADPTVDSATCERFSGCP